MRLPLGGQTYTARTVAAAAQSCINAFVEKIEDANETAKGNVSLYGAPGKELFKDLTSITGTATPLRGLWSGGGRVFVAAGTALFEIDSSGGLVGAIGLIEDDADHSPVTMFANGNQLFVHSATKIYVWNPPTGLTTISLPVLAGTAMTLNAFVDWVDGDVFQPGLVGKTITIAGAGTANVVEVFGPTSLRIDVNYGGVAITGAFTAGPPDLEASSGAFGDGYFMASQLNSRTFYISPLNDGTNNGTYIWDSLDSGVKESYPDYIRSILWCNEQLYLFGTESGEVWQNVGSQVVNGVATFPFQRIDGATFKFGSVSANAPIAIGAQVFFLGGDSTGQTCAYILNGFTPKKISTPAIESQWNNALLGATAVSASYLEEGHTFWEISFGTGQLAWVFDLTTGAWHQRARWNGSNFISYGRDFHTFVNNSTASTNDWGAGGTHLVGGDGTTGKVYRQSLNLYSDDGSDITGERALPYLYNGSNRMYYGRMTLDMETGTVASGAAPVVTRTYSDDRGETFSNPQDASLGTHNQWSKRVFWPPSGSSYERVYRFRWTGQSKIAFVTCDLEIVMGTN